VLSQPLDFVDHGEKVNEVGELAPNFEALFANELCNLLVCLEAARSSKEIACLCTRKGTSYKIKKLKKYLRSTSKKKSLTLI
jgi:hypothetical protein